MSALQAGASTAAQAIIADPTLAPVSLAFTQAADINAATGQEQIFSLGDAGSTLVTFKSRDYFRILRC